MFIPPAGPRWFPNRKKRSHRRTAAPIPRRHTDRVTLTKGTTGAASTNARQRHFTSGLPSRTGHLRSQTRTVQETHKAIALTGFARLMAT